jgi:hypothetical protein
MRPIAEDDLGEALPAVHPVDVGGFLQLGRNGDHRVVEAEGHVPCLCREDGKDAGALDAEQASRKQRQEAGDGDREKPEHGHRLQDVQQRQHDLACANALGCDVAVGERKQQRRAKGDEHAQHRARGVIGNECHVERKRGRVQFVEADPHVAAENHQRPQQYENGQDDDCVDPSKPPAAFDLLPGSFGVGACGHTGSAASVIAGEKRSDGPASLARSPSAPAICRTQPRSAE